MIGPLALVAALLTTGTSNQAEAEMSAKEAYEAFFDRLAATDGGADAVTYFACRQTYLYRTDLIQLEAGDYLPGFRAIFSNQQIESTGDVLSASGAIRLPEREQMELVGQVLQTRAAQTGQARCIALLEAAARPLCNHPDVHQSCGS